MSRQEMFEHMTWSEWQEQLAAFNQDPDDEQRKDDRNAVNAIWSIAPHLGDVELPGFTGPEYENDKAAGFDESRKRIEEVKKRVLDGKFNRKTGDPADH